MNDRKNKIWDGIEQLDHMLEEDGSLPQDLIDKRNELLAKMEVNLHCKDIHWSQKAKCKWLNEGDGNTKYFHKVANGRNRKSLIKSLSIEDEGWRIRKG